MYRKVCRSKSVSYKEKGVMQSGVERKGNKRVKVINQGYIDDIHYVH